MYRVCVCGGGGLRLLPESKYDFSFQLQKEFRCTNDEEMCEFSVVEKAQYNIGIVTMYM